MVKRTENRYSQIVEKIFKEKYKEGMKEIAFERDDLVNTAMELGIALPKNLGDVVYSFRYRSELPDFILSTAPEGLNWIIRPTGQSKYTFALTSMPRIKPKRRVRSANLATANGKKSWWRGRWHRELI